MIKVLRGNKPVSLENNSEQWTNDFLQQLIIKGEYSKVERTYKEKYRQTDVQIELEKMYGEKCCFCETGIGTSDYGHIEHRCPKSLSKFHNLIFEWNNLHWGCNRCNTNKGSKWDDDNPILDPTVDDPINHFHFDIAKCEAVAYKKNSRGQTTIDHVDLNRNSLIKARKKIRNTLLVYINGFKNTTDPKDEEIFENLILEMVKPNISEGNKAEYSMFIKQIMDQYL